MTQRVAVAAFVLALATSAGAQDVVGPVVRERGQPPQLIQGEQPPAYVVREILHNRILRQYPPTVARVLGLDPALLSNEPYLKMYPALAAFVAQHPEIAHNPAFFLSMGSDDGVVYDNRARTIRAVGDVFTSGLVLIGFCFFAGLSAWGLKTFIDHRRWLRVSKLQTDTHSKLLDRLTSNEDLLAYVQSEAGRQFLDGAPLPTAPKPHAISAPISRILWSVQVGVILVLAGAGLFVSKSLVIPEVAQPLSVMGVLSTALGAGFVLSALVSFGLSKALGLLEPPALHPHA
jgi:hypothetical protein